MYKSQHYRHYVRLLAEKWIYISGVSKVTQGFLSSGVNVAFINDEAAWHGCSLSEMPLVVAPCAMMHKARGAASATARAVPGSIVLNWAAHWGSKRRPPSSEIPGSMEDLSVSTFGVVPGSA